MRTRHNRKQFYINSLSGGTEFLVSISHASIVGIRAWNQGPNNDSLSVDGLYGVPPIYYNLVVRESQWATGGQVFFWPLSKTLHDGPDVILGPTYNTTTRAVTELMTGSTAATASGALVTSSPLTGNRNGEYYFSTTTGVSISIPNHNSMRLAVKNNLPIAINLALWANQNTEFFIDGSPGLLEYIAFNYDVTNQRITIADSVGRVAVSPNGSFLPNTWYSVMLSWNAGVWTFWRNGVSIGTGAFPTIGYGATLGTAIFNRTSLAAVAWPSIYYNHTNIGQAMAQRHYEGSFFSGKVITSLYTTGAIAPFIAKTITINRLVDPGMPDALGLRTLDPFGMWYVDMQIVNDV